MTTMDPISSLNSVLLPTATDIIATGVRQTVEDASVSMAVKPFTGNADFAFVLRRGYGRTSIVNRMLTIDWQISN